MRRDPGRAIYTAMLNERGGYESDLTALRIGQDNYRLYVGTSGYAYKEWMDAGFYPAGIKSSGMLSFYAERFSITELNYTWYQMPKVETVARQRR